MKRLPVFGLSRLLFVLSMIAPAGLAFSAGNTAGTAFNYQGKLANSSGTAQTGAFDFQFLLFDSATTGTQIGATLTTDDVQVANGLFNVDLDFGNGAFDGIERWLQIGVRPGAQTGAYTALAPRTRLAPVPYAVHSEEAGSVQKLIRKFVVGAGQSVTAGDVVSFVNGTAQLRDGYSIDLDRYGSGAVFNSSTDSVSAAALGPDQFVIAFSDSSLMNHGGAVVGQVSGGAVTFGAKDTFNFLAVSDVHVCVLSPSRVAITYIASGQALASVGNISGNSISFPQGAVLIFDGASADACVPLTDTLFVAFYKATGFGAAKLGTLTGSNPSISFGAESVFQTGDLNYLSAAAINLQFFIVAFQDTDHSSHGVALIGFRDTADNSLAFDVATPFTTNEAFNVSIAAFREFGAFLVAYSDANAADRGKAVFGEINSPDGMTLELDFPSSVTFNTGSTSRITTAAISPTSYFIGFADGGNNFAGTGVLAEFQANTLVAGPKKTFSSDNASALSATALSTLQVVVGYQDGTNGSAGTVNLGSLAPAPIIGVARTDGAAGESVPVGLLVSHSISNVHSGLTTGTKYFATPAGTLGTDPASGVPIGVAISDTEILFLP